MPEESLRDRCAFYVDCAIRGDAPDAIVDFIMLAWRDALLSPRARAEAEIAYLNMEGDSRERRMGTAIRAAIAIASTGDDRPLGHVPSDGEIEASYAREEAESMARNASSGEEVARL